MAQKTLVELNGSVTAKSGLVVPKSVSESDPKTTSSNLKKFRCTEGQPSSNVSYELRLSSKELFTVGGEKIHPTDFFFYQSSRRVVQQV
jgi:hypothetical protein